MIPARAVSFSQEDSNTNDTHNQVLQLILNEIDNVPTNFNLGNRDLSYIPVEICHLSDLERLGLNNNRLTYLPMELSRLTSLRYLNLRANALKDFPSVLSKLPRLEVLDLSRNKIRRFPEHADVGNLLNLKVLSVSRNRILSLPKYIPDMIYLKVLRLDNNPMIWPPSHVLKGESETPNEGWMQQLKQYIRNHDPPSGNIEHFASQEGVRLSPVAPTGSPEPPIIVGRTRSSSTSNISIMSSDIDLLSVQGDTDVLQLVQNFFISKPFDAASWSPQLFFSSQTGEKPDVHVFILLLETSKRILRSAADLCRVASIISDIVSRREIRANDPDMSHSGLDRSLKMLKRHIRALLNDLSEATNMSLHDIGRIDLSQNARHRAFVGGLQSHITQTVVELKLLVALVSNQMIPAFRKAVNIQIDRGLVERIIMDWIKVNVGLSSALKLMHDHFLGTSDLPITNSTGLLAPHSSGFSLDSPSGSSVASSKYHKRSDSEMSYLSSAKTTGVSSNAPILPYPSHLMSLIEREDSPDPFRQKAHETSFRLSVASTEHHTPSGQQEEVPSRPSLVHSPFFNLLKRLLTQVGYAHVLRTSSLLPIIQDRISAIEHVMEQLVAAVEQSSSFYMRRRRHQSESFSSDTADPQLLPSSAGGTSTSVVSLEGICLKQGVKLCQEMRQALMEVREREDIIDKTEWEQMSIAILDCIRSAKSWIGQSVSNQSS